MPDGLRFDTFYNYDDLTHQLHTLAGWRPGLMTIESIGRSHEGREIWCACLTNSATGPADEKPAFWCDGNIHATEVSASAACLYLINWLLEGYGSDPGITACLDTRALYIVPRLNPDGPELYLGDEGRSIRSSTRPWPYDEDPIEGMKRKDLDGDGKQLTMRFVDPNGPWKVHPDDPRLMVARDPVETGGTYYRMMPEGLLENWDGVTLAMAHTKEGLDLNRNFPGQWRPEGEQHGAGPYPTSEPEIRAAVQFITSHPNLTGGISFHTYSGVLLRPYGTQADETLPADDLWTFQKIGARGKELTGYPDISVYHDFRYHPKEVITGVFDDWMYEHLGLFAWTVEIWCPQREAGIACFGPEKPAGGYKFIDWYRDHPIDDDLAMLRWNDEALEGKGFVPWRAFDHPQLGPVEIGGWDSSYCLRNPPPHLLEKEVARFPSWVLWHTLISPHITLKAATVTAVGSGAYRVRAVVQNEGWLPTYVTKKALDVKVARPLVAEISLPEGATLVSGKSRAEVGHLEGRAYRGLAFFGSAADGSDDSMKVEWVVEAPAGTPVEIEIRSERAGIVRTQVVLE